MTTCYIASNQSTDKKASRKQKPLGLGGRKPEWVRMSLAKAGELNKLKNELRTGKLHTVCEEAACPNLNECWSQGTATIMILGDTCTRFCKFCNVNTGNPQGKVDEDEPRRVGEQIAGSGFEYVVITCVDRDDLADGGSWIFAETIREIKRRAPHIKVEALVSDYAGKISSQQTILAGNPDVLAHNVETVRALTPIVRDRRASYDQSLEFLKRIKTWNADKLTKSSIMVGLGETMDELTATMDDLREAGVDIVTFGQYLRPASRNLAVKRYYLPDEFVELEKIARAKGFLYVASGPLVRSSYRAAELFVHGILKERATQKRDKVVSGAPG
ncbi:lipoyl synthase [Spirochaetota bacterium]|nr:lipoyl synthase [Spirochaetota bacterium]